MHKNPSQDVNTMNCDKIHLFVLFLFFVFYFVNLFTHLFGLQNSGEAEWLECITDTHIEFAHELDPVIETNKQKNKHYILVFDETFCLIKNSDAITYQCKRKVCKKADKPSIMTRIAKVHAVEVK